MIISYVVPYIFKNPQINEFLCYSKNEEVYLHFSVTLIYSVSKHIYVKG